MKEYFTLQEWSVIEGEFDPEYNKISESVCSLGNGRMGQRGNFEEKYSGETLRGNYVAGIYYQKQNTNESKNLSPDYQARIPDAPGWIGINVEIEGYELDIATCQVLEFWRELNLREGYLYRRAKVQLPDGKQLEINSLRFTSLADDELGAIRYAVTPLNFSGNITLIPYLDAGLVNAHDPEDEKVWLEVSRSCQAGEAYLTAETTNKSFQVCTGMRLMLEKDGTGVETTVNLINEEYQVGNRLTAMVEAGQELALYKYAAVVSSENYSREKLPIACELALDRATSIGFAQLLEVHGEVWAEKWQQSDIVIKGDLAAQQAIRYTIFQLHQTYTGVDERLGIPAKGFTGEQVGGAIFWNTELLCLPFYLATAGPDVARNLLLYRYHHLPQAIKNAKKLGFTDGAALYPQATFNGEESHPNPDLTLDGIYRNGALAFALYNYTRYTGDTNYLLPYGLEVLVAISRYLVQRVTWSEPQLEYVIIAATGSREDRSPVSEEWYTSTLIRWTLGYTLEALQKVKSNFPEPYTKLIQTLQLDAEKETTRWQEIIKNLAAPNKQEIIVKQPVLPANVEPEAVVLLKMYLLEEYVDEENIHQNKKFYEALLRSVPESPLSVSIQSILAAKTGNQSLAYKYFLQATRQNLDENKNIEEGVYLPGMGGSWLALVNGFAGMRVRQDQLHFNPVILEQWEKYSFKINFRAHLLTITVMPAAVKIFNESAADLQLVVYGKPEHIPANRALIVKR